MGNSMPPPAAFDLVDSFARTRGSDVEIVLANAKLDGVASAPPVVLAQGKKTVAATGELTERSGEQQLVLRVPRTSFVDGVWTIEVQTSAGEPQRMQARLLVQGQRPLVLLWGEKAGPTLEPANVSGKQRLASSGGKALDKGLALLPPKQAASVRAAARRTARKILN